MPIEPTLADVIESAIDSRLLDLHTMIVGRVISYDAPTQTAVVRPVINGAAPALDGSTVSEELPTISNVPVRWERAGGYYTHLPLAPGDHGMLIFSQADLAPWRVNKLVGYEVFNAGDITRHGMSYPIFVPGCWPDNDRLSDHPMDHAVSVVTNYLRVSKANSTTADFVALDAKVQTLIANLVTWIKSGVAPSGGGPVTYATPFSAPSTAATSLKAD